LHVVAVVMEWGGIRHTIRCRKPEESTLNGS
jgi:hypothetical protein